MSEAQDRRRLKFCTWGLILVAAIVTYPLGVGPWIYVEPDFPTPVVQLADVFYAPIGRALQSDTFCESPIGELYCSYLGWWYELRFGDGI